MAIPTNTTLYGKVPSKPVTNAVTLKISKIIGFKYPPPQTSSNGYFSKSSGFDLVKTSLSNLIKTSRGERFMLPEYGCNASRYLMEPLDQTTFNEIRKEIQESVSRYLSKVSIKKLQVFDTRQNGINIKLFCTYKDEEFVKFEQEIRV